MKDIIDIPKLLDEPKKLIGELDELLEKWLVINPNGIIIIEKIIESLLWNAFFEYDRLGVRPFVRYSEGNGTWAIECYRKKLPHESKGDTDWKLIREGHIQTYNTRIEAIEKVLLMAKELCKQYEYYTKDPK